MAVILARTLRITGNLFLIKIIQYWRSFQTAIYIRLCPSSLAVTHGRIINGKGGNILAPKNFATRAEAAVMLYNILFKLD